MPAPQCGGFVGYARRACRRAIRLERSGRVDLAEAVLRRVVSRAAAAGDPGARQIGCEALARLYLGAHREAEAAVWHQQAISAWCDAGCPDSPGSALAISVNAPPEWEAGRIAEGSGASPDVHRAFRQARFRAAVRDWAAALDWIAVAEAYAPTEERPSLRSLRRAIGVLAMLDSDRRPGRQNSRL